MTRMVYNYSKLNDKIMETFGTWKKFALAMGMSERKLSRRLNGKADFRASEVQKAVDLLGISPIETAAYFFMLKNDEYRAKVQADFCLRCKGDGMKNARILDGDIVFIRKQPTVKNREIAAVLFDGEDEATLRRIYIDDDGMTLVSDNSAYAPIRISGADDINFKILGKVVAFQSEIG